MIEVGLRLRFLQAFSRAFSDSSGGDETRRGRCWCDQDDFHFLLTQTPDWSLRVKSILSPAKSKPRIAGRALTKTDLPEQATWSINATEATTTAIPDLEFSYLRVTRAAASDFPAR
jgi:hypothetical protein